MKKIMVFCVMTLMFFGLAAGVTASESQAGEYKLTLEEAVELAIQNDGGHTLEKASLAVAKAVDAMDSAEARRFAAYQNVYATPYEIFAAEMSLELAEMNKEITKKSYVLTKKLLKINIGQKYYAVLKANRQVTNTQSKVEQAEKQLVTAQAKLKAGIVSRKDVMDVEVQLSSDQAILAKAKRDKEIALYSLKKELGIEFDDSILLESNFSFEAKHLPPIADMVKDSKTNSLKIQTAEEKILVFSNLVSKGDARRWTSLPLYDEVATSLVEAKIDKKIAEKDAELAAYQAYSNIQGAMEGVTILQKRVEQAKEGLRLTKLQYQAGLTTSLMVGAAANAVADVEALYLDALYNYNIVKTMIDNGIYEAGGSAAYGN